MNGSINDWIVRIYDEQDRPITSWIIRNRTDHEASNEAMANIAREFPEGNVDWTMTMYGDDDDRVLR